MATLTIREQREVAARQLGENQQRRPTLALESARGSAAATAALDQLDADDDRLRRELVRLQTAEQEERRQQQAADAVADQHRSRHLEAAVAEQEAVRRAAFGRIDRLVDQLIDEARVAVSAAGEIERLYSELQRPAPMTSARWVTARRIAGRVVGAFWLDWPGVLPPGSQEPLVEGENGR